MAEDNELQEQTENRESYLIAEIGAITTTIALFDIVEDRYRLIARGSAPTTIDAPWNDVIRGVQQAIEQITETTGRGLLDEQDNLIMPAREDGRGVDHFAAVLSAAGPMTAVVVGLLDSVSLASARRALATIYSQEVDCFSLSDSRSQQAQVEALRRRKPDLIFLVGGTDGGADQRVLQLAETVALGIEALKEEKAPEVLYSGNSQLRPKVNELLGKSAVLHVAQNVRPTLETEQLDDAVEQIGEIYDTVKVSMLPGIDELFSWSRYAPAPAARALAVIVEYIAAMLKSSVLALDLGSENVTVVSGRPDGARLQVHTGLGIGRSVSRLLQEVETPAILEWLPVAFDETHLQDMIHNWSLFPAAVPLTEQELQIEQAIAGQIIRQTVHKSLTQWGWSGKGRFPPFKSFLLRGGVLANAARPGQAALTLLNALQPAGIFSLALDQYNVLATLGLLAISDPLVAVQSLEAGLLLDLGWVVAPIGRGQPQQEIMYVCMESEESGKIEIDVEYGTLEVLPLAHGQSAELILEPRSRFDIGLGPGRGRKVKVHGGAVGLVIDARGRPISLPQDDEERYSALRQWSLALGG